MDLFGVLQTGRPNVVHEGGVYALGRNVPRPDVVVVSAARHSYAFRKVGAVDGLVRNHLLLRGAEVRQSVARQIAGSLQAIAVAPLRSVVEAFAAVERCNAGFDAAGLAPSGFVGSGGATSDSARSSAGARGPAADDLVDDVFRDPELPQAIPDP